MAETPVAALRREYDTIARQLEGGGPSGYAEREAAKRENIAFFKKVARINVGYICLKKRIFGEAIEHLSKVIRLDNDRKATLYAHFYLGLVYLQREMFEGADTFFEKTIKLGPNLIEEYYELGRGRWFGGDQEKAKSTWAEGFKANKFNPWGKRCQEMLELVAKGEEPPRE